MTKQTNAGRIYWLFKSTRSCSVAICFRLHLLVIPCQHHFGFTICIHVKHKVSGLQALEQALKKCKPTHPPQIKIPPKTNKQKIHAFLHAFAQYLKIFSINLRMIKKWEKVWKRWRCHAWSLLFMELKWACTPLITSS